jgi:hypothetical protein
MATRLSLEVNDTAWLNPAQLEFNISPSHDLSGVVGGDWDLTRRYPLSRSAKHRAISERYVEGRRWEETDLFLDVYARRFEKGDHVRGARNFAELVKQYYGRVDDLFADMKRHGFQANISGRPVPLPGLLIGRNGEVFLDNQGNHRVAMAKVIGLDRIAGRIKCVHKAAPRDCPAFLQ